MSRSPDPVIDTKSAKHLCAVQKIGQRTRNESSSSVGNSDCLTPEDQISTLAFVLAGGRGKRLQPLTAHRCKPAIPFAGCCRIIDFTLSNCINSGIRQISILTQYRQDTLINHIRECWASDNQRPGEFLDVLPSQRNIYPGGYGGTADAIAQNLGVLHEHQPRHTLILAGDHIYKADYRKMVHQHRTSGADVTIACCRVPRRSASRYGIVSLNSDGRIRNFQEKPHAPAPLGDNTDTCMASMGIYLFNTSKLIDILGNHATDNNRALDFGHDIFPDLIDQVTVQAYDYTRAQDEHYWRDVGTIDSYYDANMDLLNTELKFSMDDASWPIRMHKQGTMPAQFLRDSIGEGGSISDCIVAGGTVASGSRIRHSILHENVTINEHSLIENTLILPGAVVGRNCRIRNTIIDSGVVIADGLEIGLDHRNDSQLYQISESGVVVVSGQRKTASVAAISDKTSALASSDDNNQKDYVPAPGSLRATGTSG